MYASSLDLAGCGGRPSSNRLGMRADLHPMSRGECALHAWGAWRAVWRRDEAPWSDVPSPGGFLSPWDGCRPNLLGSGAGPRTDRVSAEGDRQITRTEPACGPLGPLSISNSTRWPSSRVRKPSIAIAE